MDLDPQPQSTRADADAPGNDSGRQQSPAQDDVDAGSGPPCGAQLCPVGTHCCAECAPEGAYCTPYGCDAGLCFAECLAQDVAPITEKCEPTKNKYFWNGSKCEAIGCGLRRLGL